MSLLRSKLYDLEQEKQRSEIQAQRKSQVLYSPELPSNRNVVVQAMLTACASTSLAACGMIYVHGACVMDMWPATGRTSGLVVLAAYCLDASHTQMLHETVQVGTGARSEKIKTYNFKDARMSDHRTKNNYDLNKMLSGDIEGPIQAMIALEQRERLAELSAS